MGPYRNNQKFKVWIMGIMFSVCTVPLARADVYINVMAVNGAPQAKETTVKYNLPGDLKSEDILDTNGLQLDYNVNDANYYVHGTVTLQSKETKVFRIRVKDIWKMTPEQKEQIQAEIEKGFEQIGKIHDAGKAEMLKEELLKKLDYILAQQGEKADTVEKRIDAYRTHLKQMHRLQDQALAVDFWRSEPGENKEKLIRFKIDVTNSDKNPSKTVKQKHYLPAEIKPENVVETDGFEVRYDAVKQQSFLFREEEMASGQKKSYTIGIEDIWSVLQKDIDYLRKRADYAYDFLKASKFDQSAKYLYDHATLLLADIEASQAQVKDIKEHISAFRVNQRIFDDARTDVENLEKLLSVLREELEKSKVKNVLQKVQGLKGVADVAEQMFTKKPAPSTAWTFIGWTLVFVAFLTILNFIVWAMRLKDKKKSAEAGAPENPDPTAKK